jgi:hypothetical protein
VSADAYQPLDRAGQRCVQATFETPDAARALTLVADLTQWQAASPASALGTVTLLGETQVVFFTCDPGPEVAPTPRASSVDGLLARQQARLG